MYVRGSSLFVFHLPITGVLNVTEAVWDFDHWCLQMFSAHAAGCHVCTREHEDRTVPGTFQHPGLWSQGTVFHWRQHTESHSGRDRQEHQWVTQSITHTSSSSSSSSSSSYCLWWTCWRFDWYLCSVGTSQAEFNDEHRLWGDDGVRGGVGRGGDHWVGAGLSCHRTEHRYG